MKFSPLPCYLVPLRPKYSPHHPILKHPQPTLLVLLYRYITMHGQQNTDSDNSDNVHVTMSLRSKQILWSECVMGIKAIHIPRIGELFYKEE
jgi:hypothetical protein